ncbi:MULTISPECIES: GNAT family N-acetyltransferase [Caproicibacterium]|uniref:GNAT family N-acetyltransferase n=1 Tax=Caproicibacterium argilliputei TaxID=3030016 RepID=A0AA97D9L5_9FIRM|nr:GNAT family N-acetyltransferase [Caproicibacterium argilliputei]WOC31585.1 GNAT family N-acetyltransferase [Caproicibacterium argilliputei]
MTEQLVKGYQNDTALRRSFNALATETFGLSFEDWYRSGYWKDRYIPYSMINDGEVLANISVNLIDFYYQGQKQRCIQLGTVMTKSAFRNRGLSRRLMEKILLDYAQCDGFFLYANDTVLDFYPKFGFHKADEYRFKTGVSCTGTASAEPVPMESADDWERFLTEKNRRRSIGQLQMQTDDLLMFYLTQFFKEKVYHLPEADAYAIAEVNDSVLKLYDVFASRVIPYSAIYTAFGSDIRTVDFLFAPQETAGLEKYKVQQTDTALFLQGGFLEQTVSQIGSFPEIVHT